MKTSIFLTVLLLVYGCLDLVFENKIAAPFLAVIFIYMVWKLYDFNKQLEAKDKKLDDIKEMLEKALNKDSKDNH